MSRICASQHESLLSHQKACGLAHSSVATSKERRIDGTYAVRGECERGGLRNSFRSPSLEAAVLRYFQTLFAESGQKNQSSARMMHTSLASQQQTDRELCRSGPIAWAVLCRTHGNVPWLEAPSAGLTPLCLGIASCAGRKQSQSLLQVGD